MYVIVRRRGARYFKCHTIHFISASKKIHLLINLIAATQKQVKHMELGSRSWLGCVKVEGTRLRFYCQAGLDDGVVGNLREYEAKMRSRFRFCSLYSGASSGMVLVFTHFSK